MIIVPPSYEILNEMDKGPLVERVETCGRICYKSEDKITAESAIPFVRKMMSHGHNSVMEMAAITLRVECDEEVVRSFLSCQAKYLVMHRTEAGMLVTGTVRAFREFYKCNSQTDIAVAFIGKLNQEEPHLFFDLGDKIATYEFQSDISLIRLSIEEIDLLPKELLLQHRYLAVRMVVNRAVTHELVRHRPCSYLQESQRYCRYSNDKFGNQVSFVKPMFYEEGTSEYDVWKKAMEETEKLYFTLLETSTPQAARTVLPNSCKTEIITYCTLAEWKHIFALRTTSHAEPSMREIMIPLEAEMAAQFPVLKK